MINSLCVTRYMRHVNPIKCVDSRVRQTTPSAVREAPRHLRLSMRNTFNVKTASTLGILNTSQHASTIS